MAAVEVNLVELGGPETTTLTRCSVLVLGLRKGEVLALIWSAVDMQARELTIDQQLQRVRRELLLLQPKTAASDGTLPISDLVATALELRRADQERDKTYAGEALVGGLPSGPHLVFTSKHGTPVDLRTLNRLLPLDATRPVSVTRWFRGRGGPA